MAISQTVINNQTGADYVGAYGRVTQVVIIPKTIAKLNMSWYATQGLRLAGKEPVVKEEIEILGEDFETFFGCEALQEAGMDPFKAAYEYLKTLDQYEDAEDILEEGQQ